MEGEMMKKIILTFIFVIAISVTCWGEETPASIMEKYGKAVVFIATVRNEEELGLGSGFIVKSNGVIVTNYHVIEGVYPALIKLKNGDIYEDISVIDYNERKDVAVIKVKGFDLPVVKLGNSNKVKVGERVVVIGNPHGFENTISDGLLSQVRDTALGYKLHQISAPISEGSSGSPVFNLKGEVIGIATLSDILGQNLNFSVPINYVRGMISETPKMTLAEFSKTKPALPTYKRRKPKAEVLELKEFLEELNEIAQQYFAAVDAFFLGYNETVKPHEKRFKPQKWAPRIEVYQAKEILNNLEEKVGEIDCQNEKARKILEAYRKAIPKSLEGVMLVIKGFEGGRWTTMPPDWNMCRQGISKFQIASGTVFPSMEDFVALVDENCPELKEKMLPVFRASPPESGDPMVGFNFSFSSQDKIVVTYVLPDTPAENKLKLGDVIVGVKNGPEFPTIVELWEYLKTKKPGDWVTFLVDRKGHQRKINIKLGRR